MSKEINVKIKKLDERAVIPTYAHNGDVGMDMTAIDVEYDLEKDMYIYHTGLAFESEFNIGQFLFARSSNCKTNAYLCNMVGIGDSAIYRGEIQFRFKLRDSLENIIIQECFRHTINNQGIIDHDVWESIRNKVIDDAKNLFYAPYKIGDRIGQMVFLEYPTVNLEEVNELSDSSRGVKGFGSSGN